MKALILTVLAGLALQFATPARADWTPASGDELQQNCAKALDEFRARPELERFFAEAHALVIFPSVKRIGLAFGTAWGKGLVFEQGRLIGRAGQRELSLGAQFGAQSHSQIIFFRNAEALQTFQLGRREFLGRASATGIVWGSSFEPANLPDVAIFSNTGGGLMLEASAAGVRYDYEPVE